MFDVSSWLKPEYWALILFALIIFIFVNKKIPNAFGGLLLPFFAAATGLSTVANTMTYYASTTLWLVFCMQMFGAAFFECGLADIVGDFLFKVIAKTSFKDKAAFAVIAIMVVAGVASMFLQNLGITAAFIPVMLALAVKTGISRTKLLMVLPIATALGGAATLTGTPMHAVINGNMEEFALQGFSMFEYAKTAVPVWIIVTALYALFHNKLFPSRYVEDPALEGGENSGVVIKGTPRERWVVGICYVLFILAIMFKSQVGMTECASGMFLCAMMWLFKGITMPKLLAAIKPMFLLQSACILGLVSILVSSKAANLLIAPVLALLGNNPAPALVVAVFFIIAGVLTQFLTNNYVALLLFPLAVPYCIEIGLDPRGVVMAILMGCNNCCMTPMATPANLIVMDDGHIEFGDYMKPGLVMFLVGAVINIVLIPIIYF